MGARSAHGRHADSLGYVHADTADMCGLRRGHNARDRRRGYGTLAMRGRAGRRRRRASCSGSGVAATMAGGGSSWKLFVGTGVGWAGLAVGRSPKASLHSASVRLRPAMAQATSTQCSSLVSIVYTAPAECGDQHRVPVGEEPRTHASVGQVVPGTPGSAVRRCRRPRRRSRLIAAGDERRRRRGRSPRDDLAGVPDSRAARAHSPVSTSSTRTSPKLSADRESATVRGELAGVHVGGIAVVEDPAVVEVDQ